MVLCKIRSKTVLNITWKSRNGHYPESVLSGQSNVLQPHYECYVTTQSSDFLKICKLFHILQFSGFSSVAKPTQQFFLTWCFSYFSISLGCLLKSLSHSKVNETVQLGAEYGKYICRCIWWVLPSWAHTILWWVKQNLYYYEKAVQ